LTPAQAFTSRHALLFLYLETDLDQPADGFEHAPMIRPIGAEVKKL
jgi:hypothetical protein